jgi:hypothetical protein
VTRIAAAGTVLAHLHRKPNVNAKLLAAALRSLALVAVSSLGPGAMAQDFNAMIQQSLAAQNAAVQAAQNQVHFAVQQRMQDPAVQGAWQRYVASTGGRPAMNYYTFTYNWIYTRGFTDHQTARVTESRIQQQEAAALQGWRQAQAGRAEAQAQMRDRHASNQQEAGLQLRGQSTWHTPDGQALALPHTWQRGQTYRHQGMTVRVDHGGQYHALSTSGHWVPLQPAR